MNYWKKCSVCKNEVQFNKTYWSCSVSSCNKKSNPLIFCSLTCFDSHVPVMSHRDAGAFENKAPSKIEFEKKQSNPAYKPTIPIDQEILVVASKVKEYIKNRSDMNTSQDVIEVLSQHVRQWLKHAIERAKHAGRKTILDRDI